MHTLKKSKSGHVIILIIMALSFFVVPSCQDDPIIEEVNNGVPVITPKSKASITLIQLNTFPPVTPAGDSWDTIDAINDTQGQADIFFNISDPSPQPPIFWSQSSHFSNVSENDTVAFYLLTPYTVDPFGSYIDVNIYDYELPDSTLMGTVNFLIGEYPDPLNPYPDYVTSVQNGYSVTIGIRWEE